jgi:hypothetical protein
MIISRTPLLNYRFRREHYEKLYPLSKQYVKSSVLSYPEDPFLFQIYINNDKNKIPKEVYDNIATFAPEYTHVIYDDEMSKKFLTTYFEPIVYDVFIKLKSCAHKADLLRYCLLYIHGGVYMDISKELLVPLSDIVTDKQDFYSIIGADCCHISQGFISSPARNPLFLSLIYYIITTGNPLKYHDFCIDILCQIEADLGEPLKYGLNVSETKRYYLLEEKCSAWDCSKCNNKFDKYGLCCIIYDNEKPVLNARRSSYPW